MTDEEKEKAWKSICQEVEKSVEKSYLNIPIGKRIQLGVEPGEDGKFADPDSYDRNRMMVCYISLLEWQKKARQIFSSQFVFKD